MKRKKLLVVAILGLMLSLTGAAFSLTEVATADTAPKPYTVVKVEDAADTLSDIPWHVKGTNVTATNTILNDSGTGYNYALYTEAATDANKDKNPNTYDGNLGLYCSGGLINGFTMDRGWNDLINFKMNYIAGDTTWFFARKSSFNSYDWVSTYEGYSFRISTYKVCSIIKQTQGDDNVKVSLASSVGSFVDGEILDITYGVYDVENNPNYDYNNDGTADGNGTYAYFKIVGQKGNIELHVKDEDPTPVYRKTDSEKNYMQIVTGMSTAWYKGPISIQGVEQPILNDVYDYNVEGTYIGTSVSGIELPSGYEIKAGQTLIEGRNELQATYTLAEYLGKTNVSIDCKVIVEAEVPVTYTVRQLKADGTEIDSEEVVAGEEYALPKVKASDGKKFVGWSVADKLYQVGDIITINADIEISVVEVSFSQVDGASIRMTTDDKGMGGIRFKAMLTDTEDIKDKYVWKGFIMPKNLVTGLDDTTIDRAIRNNVLMTVQDLSKNNVCFTISSLAQKSFETEFVCVSYLEITYADGDVATIFAWDTLTEAKSSARSAKNVALSCLADETKDWDDIAKSYLDYYVGNTTIVPTEE